MSWKAGSLGPKAASAEEDGEESPPAQPPSGRGISPVRNAQQRQYQREEGADRYPARPTSAPHPFSLVGNGGGGGGPPSMQMGPAGHRDPRMYPAMYHQHSYTNSMPPPQYSMPPPYASGRSGAAGPYGPHSPQMGQAMYDSRGGNYGPRGSLQRSSRLTPSGSNGAMEDPYGQDVRGYEAETERGKWRSRYSDENKANKR